MDFKDLTTQEKASHLDGRLYVIERLLQKCEETPLPDKYIVMAKEIKVLINEMKLIIKQ